MFNPLASLFWSTEGAVIKNIMSDNVTPNLVGTFAFIGVWYFFTIITYGTNVPAGLFLPGMIIGCTLGDIYISLVKRTSVFDNEALIQARKKYVVLGTGGFMAGYTRMTYSLAIILMETSQDISLFVPMILCIIVSNNTGYLFTRSLYERAVRGKQMPIILDNIPQPCVDLKAGDLMASPVVTLSVVESMENIQRALTSKHHAFPLVNESNTVLGIIPRNFIIVLIQNKAFYSMRTGTLAGSIGNQLDLIQKTNKLKKEKLQAQNQYTKKAGQQFGAVSSKTMRIMLDEEAEKFEQMPEENILPWQYFTTTFLATDKELDLEGKKILEDNMDAQLDFRPYMNDNPITCVTTDGITKCVELFRKMHLRHLMVLHPMNGKLQGMITRQDLFQWLDL